MIAQVKPVKSWTIADIGTAAGLLGLLLAGAWWMSALYSEVKSIRHSMSELITEQRSETKGLWSETRTLWKGHEDHDKRLLLLENHK